MILDNATKKRIEKNIEIIKLLDPGPMRDELYHETKELLGT